MPDVRQHLERESARSGFVRIDGGPGAQGLYSLLRAAGKDEALSIYIEGDGAAWPSRWRPPADPTPDGTLVFDLLLADPAPKRAYLARPCQYLDPLALAACSPESWTNARFADAAVEAMDAAVTSLKRASGASRLRLVGHSGGGVMAMLLAARRDDVAQVITVAAPLRLRAWTAGHGLSPLQGRDPDTLERNWPPAVHFAGARDEVVPLDIVAEFARRSGGRLVAMPDFDHHCCWSRDWPRLLEKAR
ncbi:MAG: alpha/beta hydrolase [Rhodocyclales bacterium]|nr:alpha/beta hydrolase [Rhodocyclales bacterium]